MLLELFIIQLIVCFIVDYSGFIENGPKNWLRKLLHKSANTPINLKPFDCSLCMGFWSMLLFTIVTSQFTFVNCVYICILSALSKHITGLMFYISEFLTWVENKMYNLLR